MPAAARALVLFHERAGSRLCLRSFGPILAAAVVAVGFQADPDAFLAAAVAALGRRRLPLVAAAGVPLAMWAIARWASPKVTLGSGGWLRHLPAGAGAHRRAAAVGVVCALAPAIIVLAASLATAAVAGSAPAAARLAGLPVMALGAASAALPVSRRLPACALGLACSGAAWWGRWSVLAAGAGLLALADLVSGPLRGPRRAARLAGGEAVGQVRLAWRAIGWRAVGPLATSFVPLAACATVLTNNPGLSDAASARCARLAGVASLAILATGLAEALVSRRPIWGWARSLPWSSAERVRADALALAIPAAPVPLAVAIVDPSSALAVAAAAPALLLRAAGAMRVAAGGGALALGRTLGEGLMAAGVVCLVPWAAAILLAASPAVHAWAARREREVSPGLWDERHHDPSGDPLSPDGA